MVSTNVKCLQSTAVVFGTVKHYRMWLLGLSDSEDERRSISHPYNRLRLANKLGVFARIRRESALLVSVHEATHRLVTNDGVLLRC